jgi:tRNA(Ile)-lysidine synthase
VSPLDRTRAVLATHAWTGARLCLGFSGGVDSSVLLHVLASLRAELGYELSAVHVHHGLSPNAEAWAESCRLVCARLEVPLMVERVRVVETGSGLEAAARVARYNALARHNADFYLLAHHLDDQIETFFMRLLRGAGVRGLAAMDEATIRGGLHILRPLLGASRAELEAYARDNGLDAIEDESNQDTALTRNFLRHAWLPVIEPRFPDYRRVLARDIEHLRAAADLLDEMAREDAARLDDAAHPDVSNLADLGTVRAKNLLRHWLREHGRLTPDTAQLDELWRQAIVSRADAGPIWRAGGIMVRRHRGRLHMVEDRDDAPRDRVWMGESSVQWGELGELVFAPVMGQGLSRSACVGRPCLVRARVGGERLQPDCRRPARPVKDLLREAGLPPWLRGQQPMLQVGGDLAWVAGLGVDCRFQAGPDEPGWFISWQPRP